MEKQTKLEELKTEYNRIIDKIQLLGKEMDEKEEIDSSTEDLWCAMRLYAKTLLETILFMEKFQKPNEKEEKKPCNCKKEGSQTKKCVELSDKEVGKILAELSSFLDKTMDGIGTYNVEVSIK